MSMSYLFQDLWRKVPFHKETNCDFIVPLKKKICLAGSGGPSPTSDPDFPLWWEIGHKRVCLFKKQDLDLGPLSQAHTQGDSSLCS